MGVVRDLRGRQIKVLRSKNVGGDHVIGEAGEGLARVSIKFALFAFSSARACFKTERHVGRHRGGVSSARHRVESSEKAFFFRPKNKK